MPQPAVPPVRPSVGPARPTEMDAHLLRPGDKIRHRGMSAAVDTVDCHGDEMVTVCATSSNGARFRFTVSGVTPIRLDLA